MYVYRYIFALIQLYELIMVLHAGIVHTMTTKTIWGFRRARCLGLWKAFFSSCLSLTSSELAGKVVRLQCYQLTPQPQAPKLHACRAARGARADRATAKSSARLLGNGRCVWLAKKSVQQNLTKSRNQNLAEHSQCNLLLWSRFMIIAPMMAMVPPGIQTVQGMRSPISAGSNLRHHDTDRCSKPQHWNWLYCFWWTCTACSCHSAMPTIVRNRKKHDLDRRNGNAEWKAKKYAGPTPQCLLLIGNKPPQT